jgi:hypothetical protein
MGKGLGRGVSLVLARPSSPRPSPPLAGGEGEAAASCAGTSLIQRQCSPALSPLVLRGERERTGAQVTPSRCAHSSGTGRNLLCLLHSPPVLEFRPESADVFWACARYPAKTSAEEFVLLLTFQADAEGFFVEMAKFLGGFHPFGKSFGKGGALTPGDARAVEAGDGVSADVSLGVKGPIGGDVDHRPVGCDVDGEL